MLRDEQAGSVCGSLRRAPPQSALTSFCWALDASKLCVTGLDDLIATGVRWRTRWSQVGFPIDLWMGLVRSFGWCFFRSCPYRSGFSSPVVAHGLQAHECGLGSRRARAVLSIPSAYGVFDQLDMANLAVAEAICRWL